MDDWENDDDFYELPRKPGCGRVFMHKDFLKPEVRAEIEKNASRVAEEIGRKHGFRLMTPEEWVEKRAKEKALHADAAM